ncbi:MAG: isoprenylcysteine carboxylmethyltransferase family protein [Xanthobacteraceae bacterium]|nr:isoprenylcysteine carboxylmethyltransferase family protein [Xanthobacteraceae bacterium]
MVQSEEGRRTSPSPSQLLRKTLIAVGVAAVFAIYIVGRSRWPEGYAVHETIEWSGIAMIAVCIAGRTWCSLYIGGRKDRDLVRVGPYSLCRNPLYVFSIVGAMGVGAQHGCFTAAVSAGLAAALVFFPVVLSEERSLRAAFGREYSDYAQKVPRFVMDFGNWQDLPTVQIRPAKVLMTFADGCAFLIAIPAAQLAEHLQNSGMLPVLVRLP